MFSLFKEFKEKKTMNEFLFWIKRNIYIIMFCFVSVLIVIDRQLGRSVLR